MLRSVRTIGSSELSQPKFPIYFPAAHNLSLKNHVLTSRVEDYPTFKISLEKFLSTNNFNEVIVVADEFIKQILKDPNIKALCTKILDFDINAISKL